MSLVLHPATDKLISSIGQDLPQSLLLSGHAGVGLQTIARQLASSNIAAILEPQDAKGETDRTNGTISVEKIRLLYEQTRAKHTRRIFIIIDDADRMSPAASAAFLKLLEEPNSHVHFILTSHSPDRLLATIRSRVQRLNVQPVTSEQSTEFIAALSVTDAKKKSQLLFIADGLPAELTRLATDEEYFSKRATIMSDARDLLQASAYQKTLIAQKYRGDRATALQLIDSAMAILRRSISASAQPKLATQLAKLLDIREKVAGNRSVLLQLMEFVI